MALEREGNIFGHLRRRNSLPNDKNRPNKRLIKCADSERQTKEGVLLIEVDCNRSTLRVPTGSPLTRLTKVS